jgi:hypothetical protein
MGLDFISEMNILLISQVLEALEQLLLLAFRVEPLTIPRFVLIVHPRGIDDLQEDQSTVSPHQASDGGEVPGGLPWQEHVWASNVAACVDDEEQAHDCSSFGVSCCIHAG